MNLKEAYQIIEIDDPKQVNILLRNNWYLINIFPKRAIPEGHHNNQLLIYVLGISSENYILYEKYLVENPAEPITKQLPIDWFTYK